MVWPFERNPQWNTSRFPLAVRQMETRIFCEWKFGLVICFAGSLYDATMLCVCDCSTRPIVHPQTGYDARMALSLCAPEEIYITAGAVVVALSLGHVVPMFRAFSQCPLLSNIGR
ncbi:hypothetical protein TNCT_579601 [Trichonephila clavata]|uniref:Uncharacterized protein n=1 Tax=Trichonephila clavata TaxID=2740835 RepID=A0A8X6L9D3_TRICU|nr:hypothetical protein TNCT_579601 [Trichonephila clavata]